MEAKVSTEKGKVMLKDEVPAPAPMIGLPDLTVSCSRLRTSARVAGRGILDF